LSRSPLIKNQIRKQHDEMRSLKVTSVRGGTLSTATLVAMKDIAQKKHAILNATLAEKGTLSAISAD
jgi:hypothetical protein